MSGTAVRAMLSREFESSSKKKSAKGLRVNQPGDRFEREADRVADTVSTGGRVPGWSLSGTADGHIQRDPAAPDQQTGPKPNNYGDAVGKIAEAFMQTPAGKEILKFFTDQPIVKAATDFVQTPGGIAVAGSAAIGAVSALALTNNALPAQIPAISLNIGQTRLKLKISYEGPVNHPTQAMLTVSYEGSPPKKKDGLDEKSRYRAETAAIAADQEKFRAGMTQSNLGPVASAEAQQRQAEDQAIQRAQLRRMGSILQPGAAAPQGWQFTPLVPGTQPMSLQMRDGQTAAQPPVQPGPTQVLADPAKKEDIPIQRKADAASELEPDAAPEVESVLSSSGKSLDPETRRTMESRIGFDFGKVRIHSDSRAAASARSLQARAYAVGSDIVFGPGRYAPNTTDGRRLLAHELTHIVQQTPNSTLRRVAIAPAPAQIQRDPDAKKPDEEDSQEVIDQRFALSGINLDDPEQSEPDDIERRKTPPAIDRVPTAVRQVLRFPGQPLDRSAQNVFEHRFGHNFDSVRVHTGDRAAEAAGTLHASAFTIGSDIVFGRGRYSPDTPRGRLLLLHELRHVQQQRHAAKAVELRMDTPDSAQETQARSLFDFNVAPLAVQRVQCAPEGNQFSLGGGIVDSVGRSAFGDVAWPFMKAVLEGFVGGLKSDIQAGRADEAKEHLSKLLVPWNAAKFYGGYLLGLVIGLISPITDLIKGVIGAVQLAAGALEWLTKWSPVGVAVSPERQAKVTKLVGKFSVLADEFVKGLQEFVRDPKEAIKKAGSMLDNLMRLALGQAHELGAEAAHSIFDFLKKDYFDMGQSIGEVIGALIAQVLLLVFSDAIGNLVTKGASMLGKAAQFIAGKAVEFFEWVKGFASEVVAAVRSAVKGALKLFEGLADAAIEAFDALKALFTEAEELEMSGAKVAAGVGRVDSPAVSNVMESRMVTSTRTAPARVSDLTPPKVHPSNVAGAEAKSTSDPISRKAVTQPNSTADEISDLERSGSPGQPGEAAAIGTEIERMEVQEWSAELQSKGYRTYARNEFGQARLGDRRLSQLFTDQRARPDMVAIKEAEKTIIVGDITANPGTTASVPGRIGGEEALHIEKTMEYARQLRRQLPPDFADYKVFAQDRFWHAGGSTKLILVN